MLLVTPVHYYAIRPKRSILLTKIHTCSVLGTHFIAFEYFKQVSDYLFMPLN